jgi:hypothetical protein
VEKQRSIARRGDIIAAGENKALWELRTASVNTHQSQVACSFTEYKRYASTCFKINETNYKIDLQKDAQKW